MISFFTVIGIVIVAALALVGFAVIIDKCTD